MRRNVIASLAGLWFLSCGGSSSPRPPAPGTLDAGFGTAGIAQLDLGAGASLSKVAVQPDGKIVLAGSKGVLGSNADVLVARLNADGSLDTSFGTGGTKVVDLGSSSDFATGLALVASGKILVAAIPGSMRGVLIQLDAAGALDAGFGVGGVSNVGVPLYAWAMVAQPVDGKIVLGGSNGDFALARFTPAGALDATYGTGGIETTDFGHNDQVFALAALASGKIVAAGSSQNPASPFTPTSVAAARYAYADGALDTTFATSGLFTQTLSATTSQELANTILELPGGKLLLLASSGAASNPYSLLRLTEAGTLDATFGTSGKADREYGSSMILADGKVYVVGTRWTGPAGTGALQRLSVDGASDTAFGTSGEVTLSAGASTVLSSVTRQPDGKIVVAGTTTSYGVTKLVLARYWP